MQLLSKSVWWYKIAPPLFSGSIVASLLKPVFRQELEGYSWLLPPILGVLVFVGVMIGMAQLLSRWDFFNSLDKVWDAGDALIIRNDQDEDKIHFRDIVRLRDRTCEKLPLITLELSSSCKFGESISFYPIGGRSVSWKENPIVRMLSGRILSSQKQGSGELAPEGSREVPGSLHLDTAIANTRAHLLSLRNAAGHWEGELSSSALSTATAVVALSLVDAEHHEVRIGEGARWLVQHQNADGGWGDTSISKSNLSTTLLCWSALSLMAKQRANRCPDEVVNAAVPELPLGSVFARCETWIREQVGSLEPEAICKAVIGRYGKDKTFSVPILMTCAIGGRLGEHGWKRVLPLPFELAAFPRTWFGAIGLPVVSYALPALIAIGYARFYHEPPAWWNPLRGLRAMLWSRISPMLKALQPSTGGYLEATPLTSFVTMALASAGEKFHPCVPEAVEFLQASQRADGSWPIDTNLATWATTLSVKALVARHSNVESIGERGSLDIGMSSYLKDWLLNQQYKSMHPFTNAAPGGWAWTDLPGGVPDADDTSGALIALWHLAESDEERRQLVPTVEAGITWLLDLQNRDGGMPTFCRGWGTLPFDRSTPEITAHALWACALWRSQVSAALQQRMHQFGVRSEEYLCKHQCADGSWIPLWFGNEHTTYEDNPVHGTAMVLLGLAATSGDRAPVSPAQDKALEFLKRSQHVGGGWGGDHGVEPSIEETANALTALATCYRLCCLPDEYHDALVQPIRRGTQWLIEHTQNGTVFPASPIGLYFARLWYHEKMYPVIWTLSALEHAKHALAKA